MQPVVLMAFPPVAAVNSLAANDVPIPEDDDDELVVWEDDEAEELFFVKTVAKAKTATICEARLSTEERIQFPVER